MPYEIPFDLTILAHFFFSKCAKSHVRQCRGPKKCFVCGGLSSVPKLFLLQIAPAGRLGTPSNEKHFWGTKFGLWGLGPPSDGEKYFGYQVWPTPTLPHPRSSPFAAVAPLRQRLDRPVTDDQNSVLDGLKVRTLEEILQLKRNEDW